MITYTPKMGVSIEQAAGEAIGISAKESQAVLLQFNNKEIVVNHFSCIESIVNEYYTEDSSRDADRCLLEELAPLLASKWTINKLDSITINGNWAEDYSRYDIIVPAQLRDAIIQMQHHIYNQYKELKEHKAAIDKIEARFTM